MTEHTPWSRRDFIKAGVGTAALMAATNEGNAMSTDRKTQARRPNILLLMADQFRGDCLSSGGHPAVQTPNLDRIANEGVRFRCGYSTTPTCTPARAGLLTGLGPWRHGMLGYSRVAPEYPLEMPRTLRDAGYYTMGIGKMHWHPQRNLHGFHDVLLDESGRAESYDFKSDYRCWFASQAPNLDPDATGIGWNEFQAKPYALPEELHPTHWTGETAVRFLDTYGRDEPFFLKVSFARPHSPYDAPQRFFDQYADAAIPAPAIGDWAQRYAPRSGDDPNIWHGDLGLEQARWSRQGYYGSISFIDEHVGRILDTLSQRGLLDDTLIIFTADHGDMMGDHHMWRKSYAYEPSARIPFLMRWHEGATSEQRGQVSAAPVELRDILPTFLDVANAPGADQCEGRTLLDLFRPETDDWRPWIDLEHDECYSPRNHWNALTDGKTKYIFHTYDGEEQLFDLESDPDECTDLAQRPAHADTLRTWRQRLIDHLSERGEAFVKDGQLALRPKRMLHSPHYPKVKTPEKRVRR